MLPAPVVEVELGTIRSTVLCSADGEMVVNKTDLSIVSAQHCLSLVLGAGPIHYIGAAQFGTSLI